MFEVVSLSYLLRNCNWWHCETNATYWCRRLACEYFYLVWWLCVFSRFLWYLLYWLTLI